MSPSRARYVTACQQLLDGVFAIVYRSAWCEPGWWMKRRTTLTTHFRVWSIDSYAPWAVRRS